MLGLFSSPVAPNKANQNLTKLVSTGAVDTLTTRGVKRNTSAFATDIAAGTHLWAGIRIIGVTGEERNFDVSMHLRHSTTRGFDYLVEAPGLSSAGLVVPFLLTDSLTLRLGFRGKVSIALNAFGQGAVPENWEGVLPIEAAEQNMIGVLDQCVLVSSTELIGQATLFTDASALDPCGAPLFITHMDPEEVFGTVMKRIG